MGYYDSLRERRRYRPDFMLVSRRNPDTRRMESRIVLVPKRWCEPMHPITEWAEDQSRGLVDLVVGFVRWVAARRSLRP